MQSKRNFGLDLLRAIAITSVFFAHGVTALDRFAVGVDLFFVLSGFLIGRIYFKMQQAGKFNLLNFWVARWWRTLPPYFAALGIFVLAEHWIPGNPIAWYYAFFLQTFLGMKGFGPSWSLCVEEHFYLTLPLLAMLARWVFGAKAFRWLLPLAFFLPSVLRAASIAYVGGVAHMPTEWYRWTPFHCDGLIAGVYLAYLFVERPEWFRKAKGAAWAVSLLVPVAVAVAPRLEGGVMFETLNTGVLALGFAGWLRLAYDLSWEPVSFVGRWTEKAVRAVALASYSIYLVHVLIFTDLRVLLNSWPRGAAKSGFILAATLVLCIPFFYLFERPSIVTRDRFLRRKQKAQNPVTT